MLNNILKMLILAQTEQEKRITSLGLIILAFVLFALVLDSLGKGKLIKSKGPLKSVLIFILIVVVIAIFLLQFIYK